MPTSSGKRKDWDPNLARPKSGHDLVEDLKSFSKRNHRLEEGFTRAEADFQSRADSKRVNRLLKACVSLGLLVLENGRYYPQPALLASSAKSIYLDLTPFVEAMEGPCVNKRCWAKNGVPQGDCYHINCPVCGPSSSHFSSAAEAKSYLARNHYHANRKAHNFEPEGTTS